VRNIRGISEFSGKSIPGCLSPADMSAGKSRTWTNVDLNPAIWLPGKPVIASPSTAAQFGHCAALQANCGGDAENFRHLLELTNPSAPNVNVYGSITSLDASGRQHYNGLLLSGRWQAERNLNVLANWPWSHRIGLPATNISNLEAVYPHQPYPNNGPQNRHLDMGDCIGNSEDIRHIVNLTLVANTPRFSGAWARRLGSGWNLSTIYTWRTGLPIAPALNASSDNALNGFAPSGADPVPQRPNQVLPDLYAANKGSSCSPALCISYLIPRPLRLPYSARTETWVSAWLERQASRSGIRRSPGNFSFAKVYAWRCARRPSTSPTRCGSAHPTRR
jgi:hypothetical protein